MIISEACRKKYKYYAATRDPNEHAVRMTRLKLGAGEHL